MLLIARTVGSARTEASLARRICPKHKIVALLEDISRDCLWKFARSEIDGCVPLQVPQDFLIRTLDLIISDSARVVVLADDDPMITSRRTDGPQSVGRGTEGNGPPPTDPIRFQDWESRVADEGPRFSSRSSAGVTGALDRNQLTLAGQSRIDAAVPALSERQRQIIDGLIKGQPNKMIARACGITEATVKVHMKAILRKVACSNRTQLAIWAIAHADVLPARKTRSDECQECDGGGPVHARATDVPAEHPAKPQQLASLLLCDSAICAAGPRLREPDGPRTSVAALSGRDSRTSSVAKLGSRPS